MLHQGCPAIAVMIAGLLSCLPQAGLHTFLEKQKSIETTANHNGKEYHSTTQFVHLK
jgi:hypothetical protein